MGLMGIVAYRAIEGHERKLLSLLKKQAPLLKSLGGISEGSFLMKSVDGTFISVFEWKSMPAKQKAMKSEALMNLWDDIGSHGTMVKLSSVSETREVITNFKSI
jgi:heme-degrading monooxygenase HmoA